MTDQIEIRLQRRLKSATLPGVPESLREFLHDLPAHEKAHRRVSRPGPLLIAATIALLLLAALSAMYIGSLMDRPAPSPTSTPASTPIDTAAEMLRRFPGLEIMVDRRGTSTAAQKTDLGRHGPSRPFLVSLWCEGDGSIILEARNPNGPRPSAGTMPPQLGPPFLTSRTECTGEVAYAEQAFSLAFALDLSVTTSGNASWQAVVAEYPAALAEAPTAFGTPTATEGWALLVDHAPDTLVSSFNQSVVDVRVPASASRIGVIVWCSAPTPMNVSIGDERETEVACPTPDSGTRVEFAVAGGETLEVLGRPQRATWVRLIVEADRQDARPTAPALPNEIATTYFASVNGTRMSGPRYLVIGQVGSSEQFTTPIEGALAAVARGGHLGLVTWTEDGGTVLSLRDPTTGALVQELARLDNTQSIGEMRLDPELGVAYYSYWTQDGVEWRAVGFDGSGDRLLLSRGTEWEGGPIPAYGRGLVVVGCGPDERCELSMIDPLSGAEEAHQLDGKWVSCVPLGTAPDVVAAQCSGQAGVSVVISNLDGTDQHQLALGDAFLGTVVATSEGPKLVYTDPTDQAASWISRDLSTSAVDVLDLDVREPLSLTVQELGLPDDWVLLASELAEVPGQQLQGRPAPRLVNLVTREVIVLENLPNDE